MGLTTPLFSVMGLELTGRSIILLLGGSFLVGKSSYEIYEKVEGHPERSSPSSRANSMTMMIVQIALAVVGFGHVIGGARLLRRLRP